MLTARHPESTCPNFYRDDIWRWPDHSPRAEPPPARSRLRAGWNSLAMCLPRGRGRRVAILEAPDIHENDAPLLLHGLDELARRDDGWIVLLAGAPLPISTTSSQHKTRHQNGHRQSNCVRARPQRMSSSAALAGALRGTARSAMLLGRARPCGSQPTTSPPAPEPPPTEAKLCATISALGQIKTTASAARTTGWSRGGHEEASWPLSPPLRRADTSTELTPGRQSRPGMPTLSSAASREWDRTPFDI